MMKKNDFKFRFRGNKINFHHTMESEPNLRTDYRHTHTAYELYVFFEGAVNFVVENKTYAMQPNTAWLIHPLDYHYARTLLANTPYHRFAIDFDKSVVMPALQSFLPDSTKLFEWNHDTFKGDLALIENAIKSESQEEIEAACLLFINKMLLYFKQENPLVQTESAFDTTNQTVQEILQFINAHIDESLHIKDIAEQLFLSPIYVSQLFSENMKIGIMDYIKHKKILLAQELIHNGIKPTTAAQQLGFTEYSTFFRLYKKYLGCTPSDHLPN
ncbi:MAG: helix-turn-helix domain-containing protein [Clostridia bacterium]|nr:helix-turn-helix domain-containing protein [Clostridia bacterium]